MKKFNSELVRSNGTTVQSADNMSVDNVLHGVRNLLEAESFEVLYIFRTNPLRPSGDALSPHIRVTLSEESQS